MLVIVLLTVQVQVIEYDDDSGLVSKQCYDHPAGEIWRLSSAPQTPDLIASVYNTSRYSCAVESSMVLVLFIAFNSNK